MNYYICLGGDYDKFNKGTVVGEDIRYYDVLDFYDHIDRLHGEQKVFLFHIETCERCKKEDLNWFHFCYRSDKIDDACEREFGFPKGYIGICREYTKMFIRDGGKYCHVCSMEMRNALENCKKVVEPA